MATRKRSTKKQAPSRTSQARPRKLAQSRSKKVAQPRSKKLAQPGNLKTKVAVRASSKATPMDRRRQDPETLRLRAFLPGLTVSDLDRSIRFYTGPLGFIMGERWSEGGVLKGVSLKAGACELSLSQDNWAKGRDRRKGEGVRIWCETSQDIAAVAKRVKSAGERLIEDVTDQSWGARSFAIDDPDGYHLTIYQMK